jgi:hypothetical protein
MENNFLQSTWRQLSTEDKSSLELKAMIKDRGRSAVKRIRKQLILETIAAIVFLIVYYDFFDGDKKPFFANMFLVAALLFMISHNMIVAIQMRLPIRGDNIEQLLGDRLSKMKMYATLSVILRVLVVSSFLVFFLSVIELTVIKYWILSCIILVFLIQMILFIKIWNGRIGHMREVLRELHT